MPPIHNTIPQKCELRIKWLPVKSLYKQLIHCQLFGFRVKRDGKHTMELKSDRMGGSANKPGKKQGGGGVDSYPQARSSIDDDRQWIDDDRITCNQCQHMAQAVQTINMQAQDFDRIRRANHPANQWMFDSVKIKNGWARVEYIGWQCNGGQPSYIPVDVKHRCHFYKSKQNAVEVNVKEWWE